MTPPIFPVENRIFVQKPVNKLSVSVFTTNFFEILGHTDQKHQRALLAGNRRAQAASNWDNSIFTLLVETSGNCESFVYTSVSGLNTQLSSGQMVRRQLTWVTDPRSSDFRPPQSEKLKSEINKTINVTNSKNSWNYCWFSTLSLATVDHCDLT